MSLATLWRVMLLVGLVALNVWCIAYLIASGGNVAR